MAVYHADALVIRSREFGESDRVLTLYTRELGKLQAVAKGVRKPKSRQRAGAQLFTYGDFLIHKGKSLDTVNQCSPKESFPYLRSDLERLFAAVGMAELLDVSTIPAQPNPPVFGLTLTCFFLLEAVEPALVLSAYALRLMAHMGYRPCLGECAVCGENVEGESLFFSPEAGGTVCSVCRETGGTISTNHQEAGSTENHNQPATGYGRWIRAGSAAFMRQLMQADFAKIDRLRWNEQTRQEIIKALRQFAEYTYEKPLKSWRQRNFSATGSDGAGKR